MDPGPRKLSHIPLFPSPSLLTIRRLSPHSFSPSVETVPGALGRNPEYNVYASIFLLNTDNKFDDE